MKVNYWIFTPEATKEFLNPIDWDLLHGTFSEYIANTAPNVQINFPEAINIWWIWNVITKLIWTLSGTITWGTYTLSSRSIQINTTNRIKEYVLLMAIIHELTHALWFNDHKHKSGYSVWKKYNHLNEWVTQKIAEEVTDEFLARTDLGNKQALYVRQVAHNLAITILWSEKLLEQTKQSIPTIREIISNNKQHQKVSLAVAKELLNNPVVRATIEQKATENLDETNVYATEIQLVNHLISKLSRYSWKPEWEIWNLIKRWYFEWINIVELCTDPQYWIGYDKIKVMEVLS